MGGARSVGRDDIGRLRPGAKADIVIIGLTGGDTLGMGPVREPIGSLIDCGIGDDVDTVIVDGVVRMENGRIPGVDFERAARAGTGGRRAGLERLAGVGPPRPNRERAESLFLLAPELRLTRELKALEPVQFLLNPPLVRAARAVTDPGPGLHLQLLLLAIRLEVDGGDDGINQYQHRQGKVTEHPLLLRGISLEPVLHRRRTGEGACAG